MLCGMTENDPKANLHHYLKSAREAMLWKLDGLDEYDIRRPMTPTGTNLLGLVKHVGACEVGYFGLTFGRESGLPMPGWGEDDEPNADLWATADESREEIVDYYNRATAHSDKVIEELDLDSRGRVPWWGENGEVTLHRVMAHMIAETQRHAGHADIIRELIDGAAGLRAANSNLPDQDPDWWRAYHEKLEQVARQVGGR